MDDPEARERMSGEIADVLTKAKEGNNTDQQRTAFEAAITAASAEISPDEVLKHFTSAEPPPKRMKFPPAILAPDITTQPKKHVLRCADKRWSGLFAIGDVGLLTGEGGAGKSTLLSDVALAVAGAELPDTPLKAIGQGDVLWIAFEECPGLIRHRLEARAGEEHKGALSRIHIADFSADDDEDSDWALYGPIPTKSGAAFYNTRPGKLPGWEALRHILEHMDRPPRIILMDPSLDAYVGEANTVTSVRAFLKALKAIAKKYSCAILLVAHSTKAPNATPFDRSQAGGSAAWTDACRACLTISRGGGGRGKDINGMRTLAVLKANMGPSKIWTPLAPVPEEGRPTGFKTISENWLYEEEWEAPPETKKGRRRQRPKNGTGEANRSGRGQADGGNQGTLDVTENTGTGDHDDSPYV